LFNYSTSNNNKRKLNVNTNDSTNDNINNEIKIENINNNIVKDSIPPSIYQPSSLIKKEKLLRLRIFFPSELKNDSNNYIDLGKTIYYNYDNILNFPTDSDLIINSFEILSYVFEYLIDISSKFI
jgi:hypothetical protein